MNDAELARILAADGLAEAEKITGLSYKEDKSTESLGLLLHLQAGRQIEAALKETADTSYSTSLTEYLEIAKAEGFEVVLELPFEGSVSRETYQEVFYVLFHRADGILMKLDTFSGTHVNSGTFYYNWLPNEGEPAYSGVRSGGHYIQDAERLLWAGDHDARIALRLKLRRLRAHGTFITPWVKPPFCYLLHYMDAKVEGYDYKAIIAERIALLPDDVQMAIEGKQ